ncbi:MAG: hypothetical protein IJZ68_05585 [Bacteroidaceae bacterium]|nr:hypothetical protein [Bacteroidaceae bacterium]
MCKIKTGEEVKHRGDLQNVITSVILRQTGVFTKDAVVEQARKQLIGSKYESGLEVNEMVMETLNSLFNVNAVKSDGHGKYQLCASWPAINKR